MLSFIRTIKFVATVLIAAATLAGVSGESHAQTGSVRLHVVKAGFIVGLGGGRGILIYHGRRYPFTHRRHWRRIARDSGGSLVGTAHNLRTPEDIAGTYGAAGAGAAIIGGAQVARLQNEKGVVLELHGVQVGLQVSLGLAGMTLALQ